MQQVRQPQAEGEGAVQIQCVRRVWPVGARDCTTEERSLLPYQCTQCSRKQQSSSRKLHSSWGTRCWAHLCSCQRKAWPGLLHIKTCTLSGLEGHS